MLESPKWHGLVRFYWWRRLWKGVDCAAASAGREGLVGLPRTARAKVGAGMGARLTGLCTDLCRLLTKEGSGLGGRCQQGCENNRENQIERRPTVFTGCGRKDRLVSEVSLRRLFTV